MGVDATNMSAKDWFGYVKNKIGDNPDIVKQINGTFQFDLSKDNHGFFHLILKEDGAWAIDESPLEDAQCKITTKWETLRDVITGKLNGQLAMVTGKIKFKGQLAIAMRLPKLLEL